MVFEIIEDTDITRQQDLIFYAEANRQWDNLDGKIPFYYGEWIAIYVATCWKRLGEKIRCN